MDHDDRGTGTRRLGLPRAISAVLFDMDGVLTDSAGVHEQAWKSAFDDVLHQRCGAGFQPFSEQDYELYVDGRPRLDGVREFLKSRDIELPEGSDEDGPDAQTVHGIGEKKNELVHTLIEREGVHAFPGSVDYLTAVQQAGLRIGIVSSSANAAAVLAATGLDRYAEIRIDGNTFEERGLPGKPAPDGFLAGAGALGVDPRATAVFEDAVAGVEAGRAGAFGFVVGVDRTGDPDHTDQLCRAGADVVVHDLADLRESS
ncbi:beta-phosphoglucomutase family hydrolase [Nocardia sp. NPDC051981]|uniref:beta-phosphoglucomutase family hydrolase n=1 Tax=Nocardia sp. NPDC051981 TaxID=3155417 RepID=UPI00341203C6